MPSPEQPARLTKDESSLATYPQPTSSPSSMVKSHSGSHLASPHQVRTLGWAESTGDDSNEVLPATLGYPNCLAWQYATPQQHQPESIKIEESILFDTLVLSRGESGIPQQPHDALLRDRRTSYKQPGEDDEETLPPSSRPATGEREFIRTGEEVYYMQVFVKEVAVWMDSFDKEKHFSNLIPYRALKSPMLLNSLLACGARHLSMRDPEKTHTAHVYYNTASTQLLRNLENPERDTSECAAAAVILKVCELMSKKNSRKMSHGSGAPALMIRDCGWNANSTGIGSACFWLNIYMEVLNSLESDCGLGWQPDEWGLDMDWTNSESEDLSVGKEELWIQRIFYILAKVADFRAFVSVFVGSELSGEKMRLEYRLPEWRKLKRLCDKWNDTCPRTMHPLGYLYPEQTSSISLFPKVWLPKREAVLGRLLYHTTQCILTQTNPMEQPMVSEEMRALQLHHAHEVCGVVAHAEDSSITLMTVRSLIIAARVLIDNGERTEVLDILRRIHATSGWISDDSERELKVAWGWEMADHPHGEPQNFGDYAHLRHRNQTTAQEAVSEHRMSSMTAYAVGNNGLTIPNVNATERPGFHHPSGFDESRLPYQGWYEPPSQANSSNASLYSSFH
ncbi:Transcription factor atnE-like protein [Cladobotryum mycophilum]|uniref:Transcription factor atnE-like protein n=1 Tax=Cladobotryum mycophilum TaxID=491253 RepID=A0ABR0SXV5_9HYPO